jgi:hypothetical protein
MVFIAYEVMWLPDNGPLRREKIEHTRFEPVEKEFQAGDKGNSNAESNHASRHNRVINHGKCAVRGRGGGMEIDKSNNCSRDDPVSIGW